MVKYRVVTEKGFIGYWWYVEFSGPATPWTRVDYVGHHYEHNGWVLFEKNAVKMGDLALKREAEYRKRESDKLAKRNFHELDFDPDL